MQLPLAVELSFWGTLLADVGAWAVVHAGAGYAAHRLPARALARDGRMLRPRSWEPWLYRRVGVARWKDRLPEAGALFHGGVSKRRLPGRRLDVFIRETRRAELAHWWAIAGAPAFALWNPLSGLILMVAYAVLVNAPFIAVQRYNRGRALRAVARLRRS